MILDLLRESTLTDVVLETEVEASPTEVLANDFANFHDATLVAVALTQLLLDWVHALARLLCCNLLRQLLCVLDKLHGGCATLASEISQTLIGTYMCRLM